MKVNTGMLGMALFAAAAIGLGGLSLAQAGKLDAAATQLAAERAQATEASAAAQSTATTYAATKAVQLDDLAERLNETAVELRTAEKISACPNVPGETINYTSNSTVSAALKRWINSVDKITDATWEPVWNNADVTIHRLWGEFMYVYIVYFDDPGLEYQNSIFSVGQGCFIDY